MQRALPYAGLCTVLSLILQGCSFEAQEPQEAKPVKKPPVKLPAPPAVMKKKAEAKCQGGNFHCNGGWREWCKKMENRCSAKDCSPMCAWTCDSPECNQQCGPICNQPACSTRCKGFNTDSCKMKCGGKPDCKVVCPKHFCPSQDCAACKTECGKPSCKMECGVDEQPCRHVCAQPVCKWECKDPKACPKPKCEMKCKKAPDCMQKMHMFSKVPPLEPGETEIVTASAGPSPAPAPAILFAQHKLASMRVNFTRMDKDGSLHTGQVVMGIEAESAMDSSDSWTSMVAEVSGQVMESGATCTSGKFHCEGHAAWCSEQQQLGCKGSQNLNLRPASQKQNHLQP